MHKQLVNEMRLEFRVRPAGPLLIKSGKGAGADPTLLDLNFVRVYNNALGERTVYLPGSSLKGVLRSYSEKIARTVGVTCCDPLSKDASCGRKIEREEKEQQAKFSSPKIYSKLCTICRMFGHLPMASHLRVADAYPNAATLQATNQTEERDGVAIDRISGSVVGGGLFQLEVVTRGAFFGQLVLRNFQVWQIGLLAIALRDIDSGLVPIGFAKSRGLGEVRVNYQRLEISYPGQLGADAANRWGNKIAGVTAFRVQERDAYDLEPEAELEMPVAGAVDTNWCRVTTRHENEPAIAQVLGATVDAWASYVEKRGVAQ